MTYSSDEIGYFTQLHIYFSVTLDEYGQKYEGSYYRFYKWDSDPEGSDPFDVIEYLCKAPYPPGGVHPSSYYPSYYSSYGNMPGTNILLNTGSTQLYRYPYHPYNCIGPGMTIQSQYGESTWYLTYLTNENPATTDTPNLYSCFYNSKFFCFIGKNCLKNI